MRALSYLLITELKNRILILKRKPAYLILYGFVIVMLAVSMFTIVLSDKGVSRMHFADVRIIYSFIAGLGLLFLFTDVNIGLSTGSTLFSMADVGLLFVAPISTKKVLIYGLISTMGKSLLAAFFILYQIGNLKVNFNYGLKEIIALFLIYAIMVLFGHLLSIAVYIYTNGNTARKTVAKTVLYIGIGILIIVTFFIQRKEQITLLEALLRMVDHKWFTLIPLAGWSVMFFKGITDGLLVSIFLSLGFFIISSLIIIYFLTIRNSDYYEDVLLSTEVTYQKLRSAKDGRHIKMNKKVKVREEDQGLLQGSGALTLVYKHLLEMKRSSRFIFINGYTVFTCFVVGIAGYNFKVSGASYIILGATIYLQYFYTMIGKLKLELMKPYIYLIPEKSIKKVFAASLTSIIKPCIDSICIFTVFGFVGMANPLTCIFFALAYASSGALFVSFTVLYQRLLGGQPNRLLQMMIGVGLLILIMLPGIVSSAIASFFLTGRLEFLIMLPFSLFCVLVTWLIFLFCGNLIDKAEYTGK